MGKIYLCLTGRPGFFIRFMLVVLIIGIEGKVLGQVSITSADIAVTQNFDGLPSSGTGLSQSGGIFSSGWSFLEGGSSGNLTYQAGTGSNTTGETYSFGATGINVVGERAFGMLQSGTLNSSLGFKFINNTGITITSITIGYTGEVWRRVNGTDILNFSYQAGNAVLNSGIWTSVPGLDFITPVTGSAAPTDGNAIANRTVIDPVIIRGLLIADGSSFTLRWIDATGASSAGMGIDDFSITLNSVSTPLATISNNGTPITAQNFFTSSTNNVISKVKVVLSNGTVDISSMQFSTAATSTYLDTDIAANGFKLWRDVSSSFNASTATQIGTGITSTRVSGSESLVFSTAQTALADGTYYYFLTADVSSAALSGRIIDVNVFNNISVSGGSSTGSASAAGPATFIGVPVLTGGSTSGITGNLFTYNISATNSPNSYKYVSGTFPPDLSLNTATGQISGNPTVAGSYSIVVSATNGAGTGLNVTISFVIVSASYTSFDNFNRVNNPLVGIPSSGNTIAWNEPVDNYPYQSELYNNRLDLNNNNSAGATYDYFDMSGKYTTTFSNANTNLTWFFNMRQNQTNPGGFGIGAYGEGFILGSTSSAFSTLGNGYAVVFGEAGIADNVRLVRFNNGMKDFTEIIRNSLAPQDGLLNIRVDFSPCTNTWTLSVNDSGSPSNLLYNFTDPSTVSYTSSGSATDNIYTSLDLKYVGPYYNYNSAAGNFASFDNIYIPNDLSTANTYVWNGTTTDYQVSTNWTPSRTCIKPTDLLQFTIASPVNSVVTNVPTQTIGQLLISSNRAVSFKDISGDGAISYLTIGGGSSTDLQVEAGSSFVFDVALSNSSLDAIIITLSAGVTANISGTVVFKNSNNSTAGRLHQLFGTDASSIIVANGGCVKAKDLNGAPFGTTGNSNIVIFEAGSRYESFDGSSPFGLTQPNSKVVFNSGSLYKHAQSTVPSFSGRIYANFEYDFAGTTNFLFGGNAAVTMDSLLITNGTFNITGASGSLPVNMFIKKDLIVGAGATFNYSPMNALIASAISFSGISNTQKINNSGSLIFGRFATLELNNNNTTSRLDVESNIKIEGTLKITAGNLNLSRGDVTIQSDSVSTANVSTVNGTITYGDGRFVVERYLFAQKSWRFLSVPLLKLADDASTPTINNSWREGGTLPNRTGYGTIVTGPGAIAFPAGVDEYTQRGSMKYYHMESNTYVEIKSDDLAANKTIANDEGYYIFVRGDRGINVLGGATGKTTLRARGKIRTGNQIYNLNALSFQSVGNPYPSRLNFSSITKTVNVENSFVTWNPSNNGGGYGVGRFQQYVLTGSDYVGVYGTKNFIESGEAFFISSSSTGSGSITIKEADKTTGSANVSRVGVNSPTLEISLYAKASDGADYKADGTLLNFEPSFSNLINNQDVKKFNNATDNIYILKDNTKLFAERRSTLTSSDTISLALTNTRIALYRFEIDPSVLGNLPLNAYLIDKFLHTETPISLTNVTNVNFSITSDGGSKATDRFLIVFKNSIAPGQLAGNFITFTAEKNSNKIYTLKWTYNNEINIAQYSIERSNNGTVFTGIGNKNAGNLSNIGSYIFRDSLSFIATHYYRIKATSTTGEVQYSAVVKVIENDEKPFFAVQPNPVVNKTLHINFEKLQGDYDLRLIAKQGATVFSTHINVSSVKEVKSILLSNAVAAGIYELLLEDSNGKKLLQKVYIK